MTLVSLISGRTSNAHVIRDGGSILLIGDSIVQQSGNFLIGGHELIDGIGSMDASGGVAFTDAAWTDAGNGAPPTGLALLQILHTTNMNAGTSPNNTAWNSQILSRYAGGNFFAAVPLSHVGDLMVFGRPWLRETLVAGATRVRVPILHDTEGITTNDIRIMITLSGSTTSVAASEYFSTYSSVSQVVWHEVVVPIQASLADGYSLFTNLEYRPNIATRAGEKLKNFAFTAIIRQTRRTNSVLFMHSGIGSMDTEDLNNSGNAVRRVTPACIAALLEGIEADTLVINIGQNGRVSPNYEADVDSVCTAVQVLYPCNIILFPSPATVVNTGGELGTMGYVEGAYNLSLTRDDTLFLNSQRVLPSSNLLYQERFDAFASQANGTLIYVGDVYTHTDAHRYFSKITQVKTASTPAFTDAASWVDLGTGWTSGFNLDCLGKSNRQDQSDGVHLTYPEGMKSWRTAFHALMNMAYDASNANSIIDALPDALLAAINGTTWSDQSGHSFDLTVVRTGS